jgi:CheY-like chemotaxis protein
MTDAMPAPCILVVDDDALIAINTVDMVQQLGYVVLEAYSAKQALDIITGEARVDAVITDYAMPGMNGLELAIKAREMLPGLPVLLATGYSELPDGADIELPLITKPFGLTELSEQLSRLLGEMDGAADRA